MNIREWMKRHSLITYFGLTYTITWVGILLLTGTTRFQGTALPARINYLMFLVMLIGPSSAGVITIAITEGRDGLGDLLMRMGRWRIERCWYAVALLTTPYDCAAQPCYGCVAAQKHRTCPCKDFWHVLYSLVSG